MSWSARPVFLHHSLMVRFGMSDYCGCESVRCIGAILIGASSRTVGIGLPLGEKEKKNDNLLVYAGMLQKYEQFQTKLQVLHHW